MHCTDNGKIWREKKSLKVPNDTFEKQNTLNILTKKKDLQQKVKRIFPK